MIKTTFLKNVFKPSGKVVKVYSPEEIPTLEEFRKVLEIAAQDFVFVVNGFKVDSNKLKVTRLNSGDYVNVFPYIGTGDDGKNIAGVVAGLALMAFTGGAGGGLMSWLTASNTNMLIGGMALFLGGGLLVGNQKIPSIDTPDFSGSAFENGHSWNPDQISLKPGGAIPETFGTVRTSGQLIGRRITTKEINSESVQMLYLLLAAGEGELDSITDIQINDTASASIANLEVETRLGTNGQIAVNGILSEVVEQQTFNHELPLDAGSWVTKTQTVAGEKVILEFVHAAGVYSIGGNGAQGAVNVYNRVQYREIGASTWTDFFSSDDGYPARKTLLSDRKPVCWKHEFTPPDPSKLYEFRAQNYCLSAYNDILGWTEIPSNYSMKCSWISLTITDSDLMTYPNTALVALGIPASENLNGGMPRVSWRQTRSKIWAWNPTTEAYEQKSANRHSWAVYDTIHKCRKLKNVNTGLYEFTVFGEPKENLNYTQFSEWADFEAELNNGVARATCNFLLDSADKLWPIVQKIASGGRGFVIQRANVFTPIWDCARPQTQIFTSGNILNGTLKGRYLSDEERATAIEASFRDEDNNFDKTTFLVRGDNYDPSSLQNPTQIYYPTLTNAKEVWAHAKLQLKKNELLKREMEFKADIDSITCEIDDVIGIQSDYANWGVGGQIRGATTTQIVIDRPVSLEPGQSYAIVLRLVTGLYRRKLDSVTVATTTDTLNFTQNPFPEAPELFTLYAFGIENLETKPFKIIDIRRNGDLQASIKCLEYVEGIHTEASDFPVINYAVQTAGINSLTVNPDSDTQKLGISWSLPENTDYTGSWVIIDGKPIGFVSAENTSVEIESVPGSHTVRVIPVDSAGNRGTPEEQNITLATPALADVSNIAFQNKVVTQSDGTNFIFVDGSFDAPPLAEKVFVEIGEGSSPASYKTVQESAGKQFSAGPLKPGQLYTFRFTAKSKYAISSAITDTFTTTGDTVAPGKPSIAVSSYLKNIKVTIDLAAPPSDLAGFRIYRNIINDPLTAVLKATVTSQDGKALADLKADGYGDTYYFWAAAFDTWGNEGVKSDYYGPVTITAINGADLVNGALNRSGLFGLGVIDTSSVADESIITGKLAAGAVTASKMLVGNAGKALNSDPNFLDNNSWYWRSTTNPIASQQFVTISDGKVGRSAVQNNSGYALNMVSAEQIAIDSSTQYRLRCWVKQSNTNQTKIYLTTRFVNADGSLQYQNWPLTKDKTTTAWEELGVLINPPSSAVAVIIGIDINYYGAVCVVTAQDLRLEERLPAVLIQDGAVVAEKIATGAVEAGKIAAGAVETGHLSAGAVTTDKMQANAVTASIISAEAMKTPAGCIFEYNFEGLRTSMLSKGVPDLSGRNCYGKVDNVTLVDTEYGKALEFNGTTSMLWNNYPHLTTDRITAGFTGAGKSLSVLLKTPSNGGHYMFGWYTGLDSERCLYFTGSRMQIKKAASGSVSTHDISADGSIIQNQWVRVTLIYDGTNTKFYFNEEYTGYQLAGDYISPCDSIRMGTVTLNGVYYKGACTVAEMQIFNKQLTMTELKTLVLLPSNRSGVISADQLRGSVLESLNYSTTQGTQINLDDGEMKFGGSANPALSYSVANGFRLKVPANAALVQSIGNFFFNGFGFWAITDDAEYRTAGIYRDVDENQCGHVRIECERAGTTYFNADTSRDGTESYGNNAFVKINMPVNGRYSMYTNGVIRCYGISQFSNLGYKADINFAFTALKAVKAINVFTYCPKGQENELRPDFFAGIDAKEFQEYFPSIGDGYSVKSVEFILWKAFQEYMTEQEQEKKVLEDRLSVLEKAIQNLTQNKES